MSSHDTAQAPLTVPSERIGSGLLRARVLAIMLMLAGWGWDNGQFVQPINSSWGPLADALHLIPVVALVLVGLRIIMSAVAGTRSRGAEIGVTIVALVTIVGCVVMVVLGATNSDPNSVGVHTAEDWMPTIVMNLGAFLWLGTFLFRRTAS